VSDVLGKIREFIAKEGAIPPDRIEAGATLKDLQLESLDLVQIIFAIEEHFDISLPYDNIDLDGQTVRDLVVMVERLVSAKQQQAT
jgi:acyl carrier protein